MTKKASEKLKYLIPVLLLLVILVIVASQPSTFAPLPQQPHIIDAASPLVGQELFTFLWQYRGVDLMIQSLFLFTAIICCITLLRAERGE